ncbi:MAG: succinylglutamate-semialdehyde dehydrogenase [Sphingobium sp.]
MTQQLLSYEPATGALLWRGDHSDVAAEVARACSAWVHWAAQSATFRIETLRRFTNVVRNQQDALADRIARETGKPLWEAHNEVAALIARVDASVAAYSERTGQRRIEGNLGARQSVRHKPHGVMAVLGPYNYPASQPGNHIIPALIAGNAVIFKPHEMTPATGALLVDLFHQAGIPEDVLRLVIGGAEASEALLVHPDIGGILFTGSTRTGIAINQALATQPGKIIALEMGGNNPVVLWDTPDLPAAATLIVQSAFGMSGQRNTAARRLIVRDTLADALITEITKITDRLIVDHPHADPAPFMGPVIDNHAADGLTESFLALMSRGAKPIRHMRRPHGELPFLTPAILDVTKISDRPDVDMFGPLLHVVQVENFESAIAEANNSQYGLSASLIGGNPELYEQFWSGVRAGIINWNRPNDGMSPGQPFGGVGLSGNHRPGAYYAADFCAYPVSSAESVQLRASIGVGMLPVDIAAMGD